MQRLQLLPLALADPLCVLILRSCRLPRLPRFLLLLLLRSLLLCAPQRLLLLHACALLHAASRRLARCTLRWLASQPRTAVVVLNALLALISPSAVHSAHWLHIPR
jgi:hypothetical protein